MTFQFEELIPSDCVSFEANVDEADDFSKLFTIDISEIMVSTSALLADLPKLNICDTLDTYREKLGISPCLDGAVEYYDNVTLQTYSNSNWLDANSTEPQNEDIPVVNDDIDDYVDDFDAGEDIGDYFVDNNDALDDEATDDLPLTKPIEYEEPKNMKIKWSDTTGERSDGSSIDLDVIQQGLNNLNATDAQDYSYFQINALAKSNNAWAGARHWNYATRLRSQANKSPEGVDEVEATEANKKEKKSSKKNIPKIEFTGEFVDESLLACAKKGKSNPTKLTSTALEKAAKEASSLMLPEDKKVHIKDLCRLFLAPQVIVPPPHALSVVLSTVLNSDSSKDKKVNSSKFPLMYANSYNGINDTVWGGAMGIKNAAMKAGIRPQMVSQTNFNRSEFGDQPEARNSDYDDVNDYYDDAGEAGDITMNNYDSQQYSENTEFAVDHTQLLQATRKVEKIEIG